MPVTPVDGATVPVIPPGSLLGPIGPSFLFFWEWGKECCWPKGSRNSKKKKIHKDPEHFLFLNGYVFLSLSGFSWSGFVVLWGQTAVPLILGSASDTTSSWIDAHKEHMDATYSC